MEPTNISELDPSKVWRTRDGEPFMKKWQGAEISDPQQFLESFVESEVFQNGISSDESPTGRPIEGFRKFAQQAEKRAKSHGENPASDEELLYAFLSKEASHDILVKFAQSEDGGMFVIGDGTPGNLIEAYDTYAELLKGNKNQLPPSKWPMETDWAYQRRLSSWRDQNAERLVQESGERDYNRMSKHNQAAAELTKSLSAEIPSNFSRAMVVMMGISENVGLDFKDVIGSYSSRSKAAA